MKTFNIKAGERVRVFHKIFSSLPATYQFRAEPLKSGEKLSGRVEIEGANWPFPTRSHIQDLVENNSIEKKMTDNFFSVYTTPDVDVVVSLRKTNFSKLWPFFLFALAVTGIALAILFTTGFYG